MKLQRYMNRRYYNECWQWCPTMMRLNTNLRLSTKGFHLHENKYLVNF